MTLPPMHLMIFLAMPASCHLIRSLNSWFPSPNSHTFSRSTSSYKMRNIFLYWPKLLIWLFCSLLDFLFPASMLWAMAIQHLLTVPTLSETLQLASVKRRSESDSIFIEQSNFFFPQQEYFSNRLIFSVSKKQTQKARNSNSGWLYLFFLIYHDIIWNRSEHSS